MKYTIIIDSVNDVYVISDYSVYANGSTNKVLCQVYGDTLKDLHAVSITTLASTVQYMDILVRFDVDITKEALVSALGHYREHSNNPKELKEIILNFKLLKDFE